MGGDQLLEVRRGEPRLKVLALHLQEAHNIERGHRPSPPDQLPEPPTPATNQLARQRSAVASRSFPVAISLPTRMATTGPNRMSTVRTGRVRCAISQRIESG